MHIIAGLGNPGPKHEKDRHNVGFMAADEIVRRHGFSRWSDKFEAKIAEGTIGGEKVLVVKPQTYMNLSGQAIGKILRFHKLEPANLTVLYDELDLPPGKLRVKTGGGAGGHNGIRSIDAHCGPDYHRVRIGIGHPGDRSQVTSYVLGSFAKADHEWLDPLLAAIADNADLLVTGAHDRFMNRISTATSPARPTAAPKAQSHIRQARPKAATPAPESGPLAAMLKKLFQKD